MADIGISATLKYNATSGINFTAIPKCKSISLPGISVNSVDTTNLDNTDYYKTFIPGTIDPGSVSFSCEFSSATYTALFDLLRESIHWKVTTPDSDDVIATFDGFLTALDSPIDAEAEHMITGTIKVTGAITVA